MRSEKVYTINKISKNGKRSLKESSFDEEFQNTPITHFFEKEDSDETEPDDTIDQDEWYASDDSKDNFDYDGDYDDDDDSNYSSDEDDEKTGHRRAEVMRWLESNQNKHSVLAYKLYPSISKDGARSKFSKKYRGEDKNGHRYDFDSAEINRLYNMKNSFIQKIQESVNLLEIFDVLTESEIKKVISKTVAKYIR